MRSLVTALVPGVAALVLASSATTLSAADDLLERSRAAYAALASYTDTGVVLNESGTASSDRHTFTTSFNRVPRRFRFDFANQFGDRYVIWGDPDAFHTWWKTTGVKDDYPNPSNIGAFTTAGTHTVDASSKIPSLLYARGALPSSFTNFSDAALEGSEVIAGRPCSRLGGKVSESYGRTGREINVHHVTIWIDAESLLIRKVVEEWTTLPGHISRLTTTFEPQVNPKLDDARFQFVPPR